MGEGGEGGVCFSVFHGSNLFVFLMAKKLYVLKLQRRNLFVLMAKKERNWRWCLYSCVLDCQEVVC